MSTKGPLRDRAQEGAQGSRLDASRPHAAAGQSASSRPPGPGIAVRLLDRVVRDTVLPFVALGAFALLVGTAILGFQLGSAPFPASQPADGTVGPRAAPPRLVFGSGPTKLARQSRGEAPVLPLEDRDILLGPGASLSRIKVQK